MLSKDNKNVMGGVTLQEQQTIVTKTKHKV